MPAPADAQAKAKISALTPQLDAFLERRFSESGATGMAAGIVLVGELVYERTFGVKARGSTAAIDGDSVFRVASLSKSFTALAVLQLRDAGELSLDVPIAQYLPELHAVETPTPITARLLLTHSAGLPWDDTWGAVSFGFSEADLDQLLQSGVTLAREPATAFAYSNLGYALLGRLVARRSGVSFAEYTTQYILRPLGMRATAWRAGDVPAEQLAIGYWGDAEPLIEAKRVADGVFEAAGGVYTTLHDYARYLSFQLSAYSAQPAPDEGPVRHSSLRESHQAQRRARQPLDESPIAQRTEDGVALNENSYGLGWFNTTSCSDTERVEHGGWEPGYIAGVIMLPAQRLAVVTMATSRPVRSAEGMLKILREGRALPQPIEAAPHSALLAARQAVNELLAQWNASLVQRAVDARSVHYPWYARMQVELPKLSREHGRCEPDGPLHAGDRLSGAWKMQCERGFIEFSVDLTPATQPLIHMLRWRELLPPVQRLAEHAAQLTAAIATPDPALPERLASTLDRERLRKRLAHAALDHGACTIERALQGDGQTQATFALSCQHEPLELALQLDPASGLVSSVDLHRPRASGAVCWH